MKLTLLFIFAIAVLLFLAFVMILFFGTIIAVPIILIKKSKKEATDETMALQINPGVAEAAVNQPVEGIVCDQQIDSTI